MSDTTVLMLGDCDASLETQSFWINSSIGKESSALFGRSTCGVIYYLNGNELVGALAWMPNKKKQQQASDFTCAVSVTNDFRSVVLQCRDEMRELAFDVSGRVAGNRSISDFVDDLPFFGSPCNPFICSCISC